MKCACPSTQIIRFDFSPAISEFVDGQTDLIIIAIDRHNHHHPSPPRHFLTMDAAAAALVLH
jgi:hypothetical protein